MKPTDAEIAEKFQKLIRSQSPELREELILLMSHIPRMVARRCSFIDPVTSRRKDSQSAGMIALIKGIDWILEGKLEHDNYGGYLYNCVLGAVRNYVYEDRTIRVRRGAKSSVLVISENDLPRGMAEKQSPKDFSSLELDELLRNVPSDKREKFILESLIEGESQAEIGRTLGVSRAFIGQLVELLKGKVSRYLRRQEHLCV